MSENEQSMLSRPHTLHGYFRSGAAWRVRIALGLKGLEVAQVSHHLRRGEQTSPHYLSLNPQGLVPCLVLEDGAILTQSIAIIEYLDEAYPTPRLLPDDSVKRAKVRAFSLVLAADTHPVQNLRVLEQLRVAGFSENQIKEWAAKTNADGLAACEALVPKGRSRFAFGEFASLADICLIPQLASARRFGINLEKFPRLLEIEDACKREEAFVSAEPDRQPDVE